MPKAAGLEPPRAGLGDGGGELGHRAQAGRDILSLSLPAQAPCPVSSPLSRSTSPDGSPNLNPERTVIK